MKQPAWTLEIVRDTNAPLALVLGKLADGSSWGTWHPRRKKGCPKKKGEMLYCMEHPKRFGLSEIEYFECELVGTRVKLIYRARFQGWPLLILMGWLRLRMHPIWERFVRTL